MSTVDVLAQIPDVKPEAPPFFPELVGTFDAPWWLVLAHRGSGVRGWVRLCAA